MIAIRKADERGHFDHGWLDTRHTFSFADYHDPRHMGFRVLRVINEDRVKPGQGFGTHGHRDMEILTVVLSGAIAHKDSLGSGEILRPGEVQRMTAGTGVTHSEFNPSTTEPLHLYQIWIFPNRKGLKPEYEQRAFPAEERRGRLRLVASPDGADGSLRIHQDARVYVSELSPGQTTSHGLGEGRHAWVQAARGTVELNGRRLDAGDGAAVSAESDLVLKGVTDAELLLFDLP
ncbi:MAG TPA: pirin family protein [Planctomycetota bacterium]|nr:pirin family protein [Planctomycetota bacterium]